jgi:polyisoprenoid-binding protein YceI
MKNILIIGAVVVVLGALAYVYMTPPQNPAATTTTTTATNEQIETTTPVAVTQTVVAPGSYTVNISESSVSWAGKKPLLEGYINDGSLALQSGNITVGDNTASGSFIIDMNTLSVSNTPTKPGKESMLAEHLMGENWFNVPEFPTATFEIKQVTARADSDTTFVYEVEGELTMKGQTHPLSFPATIFMNEAGQLLAKADTQFDRTLWGITAGSASFFDNLADNAVDNMVALSFTLVAEAN